ncbi:hypothetical protein [Marivita hallyeonensis]|uniref:hypothetical protein n=1 Tax=Marivita hallyeonensis TaxID=996342 RepID=UPI000934155E|nr:hypothetical protein [Marivita hallyeonensis]
MRKVAGEGGLGLCPNASLQEIHYCRVANCFAALHWWAKICRLMHTAGADCETEDGKVAYNKKKDEDGLTLRRWR